MAQRISERYEGNKNDQAWEFHHFSVQEFLQEGIKKKN
jgi:hypothetical protein